MDKTAKRTIHLALLMLLLTGCASTKGPAEPHDPFEGYNRAMHKFNKGFDDAVAKPVAKAYQQVTPTWMDKGITNFFSNLDDVVVLFDDLLQLKFTQAASDAARIAFNTTFGLLGFVDVASHMELPKHREDFGQTLGYWGVPPGPYFVLPFLGPSTIRDSAGLASDYALFDPVTNQVDSRTTRYGLLVVDFVDTRADLLQATRLLDEAALDPYIYTREAYLQRRRYYVYDGDPPMEDFPE